MSSTRPNLGDRVHYTLSGRQCRAAVITYVHQDSPAPLANPASVNLLVLFGQAGEVDQLTGTVAAWCQIGALLERVPFSETPQAGCWSWPQKEAT